MAGFPVTNGVTTVIPPPDGVTPNFENPRQQYWLQHYLVFGIGAPIALMALCQRFYTKMFLSKGLQVDDAFMFLGWALSLVTQAMLTNSIVQGGMCTHAWEMPLTNFEAYSVVTYITAPLYQMCNGFVKLSLLTFYLHISPQRWFRLCVWISIGIVTCYTTIITLMMFFRCNPVAKAFDFTIAHGSCMNAGVLYMATAVSNIITDVILFVLPIPMVVKLKMGVPQKIGAIFIFSVGSVTIATSVVRLAFLPAVLKSQDPSWDAAEADVWTFVEGNLFIICGSLPTMRRFFRHFFPRIFGGSSAGHSNGPSYANAASSNSRNWASRRRNYSEFHDDSELHVMGGTSANRDKDTSVSSSAAADPGADLDGDSHSERAILQTKTFTVQYN